MIAVLVLEIVDSVTFPVTHKAIKEDGIQKLMDCLEKSKSKAFRF